MPSLLPADALSSFPSLLACWLEPLVVVVGRAVSAGGMAGDDMVDGRGGGRGGRLLWLRYDKTYARQHWLRKRTVLVTVSGLCSLPVSLPAQGQSFSHFLALLSLHIRSCISSYPKRTYSRGPVEHKYA